MIDVDDFLDAAKSDGIDFWTGVPCSFLTPVINRVISRDDLDWVGAASEGEAVGIAAGAWLAGRKTSVIFQNSGLGNAVNPLTSLNEPFRIPSLLITTWRGQPGLKDEPQHELMGEITDRLLDTLGISNMPFPQDKDEIGSAMTAARSVMDEASEPFAFILEKGSVARYGLDQEPVVAGRACSVSSDLADDRLVGRYEALQTIVETATAEAGLIATTGKCGRELFTIGDRDNQLYMVGAMGCASGVGLGAALSTDKPVIVLDGDGAALMKLGTMATIGAYGPPNLIHVLLDNGVHDSTGGQATVSPGVDFAAIAGACGYSDAVRTDHPAGLSKAISDALHSDGPSFIHMKITPGSIDPLGRPTISPDAVARRFRDFLTG